MGTTPPPLPETPDDVQLRQLALFHTIFGVVQMVFSLFPLIHVGIGIAVLTGAIPMHPAPGESTSPRLFGWLFVLVGSAVVLFGEAVGIASLLAARFLRQRRRHTYCMVVAAINCMLMPLGTVLGVFTLIVLNKPAIRARFAPR